MGHPVLINSTLLTVLLLVFAEDAAGRGYQRPGGRPDGRQVRLCLLLRRRLQVPHRGGRRADEGGAQGGIQVGNFVVS